MKSSVIGLMAVGFAAPAYAHHSNDYHFDRNVDVTVTGTVKEFRFINPHSRLVVDVVAENGDVVTWDCERSALSWPEHSGARDA